MIDDTCVLCILIKFIYDTMCVTYVHYIYCMLYTIIIRVNVNAFADENECKYRPCDIFAHCTNTLGSFQCSCFPGYQGYGFHCEGTRVGLFFLTTYHSTFIWSFALTRVCRHQRVWESGICCEMRRERRVLQSSVALPMQMQIWLHRRRRGALRGCERVRDTWCLCR